MTAVLHANEQQFNELLASNAQPILVDFAASWCGPCKAMAPALEAYAQEQHGAVTVVKVDIDEARALAMKFHVRAVPTLAVIRGGQVLGVKTGALTKSQLANFVTDTLA